MDKIKRRKDYGLWYYGEHAIGDKLNELIEGYNEIIKRLERIYHFLATHQHINGRCDIIEQNDNK